MKFKNQTNSFNALPAILEIFEFKDPKPLLAEQVSRVISSLALAGIECEHPQEAVECLKLLAEMQVLIVTEKGMTYLVGNLYNGK